MKQRKKFFIMNILCLISQIFLIVSLYQNLLIPLLWKNIILIGILIVLLLLNIFILISIHKNQTKKLKTLWILSIIFLIGGIILGIFIQFMNHYTNIQKEKITYTSVILTLQKNNKDLQDMTLGILKNKESYEGYIIPHRIIKEKQLKEENIVYYNDFMEIMQDIINKKIDAGCFPNHYLDTINEIEEFKKDVQNLKIIYSKKQSYPKNSIISVSNKNTSIEPFSLLIMGIDSTENTIHTTSSFNGDALLLLTFDPKNLNITMLSIPRDTYVPITCFPNQKKNKITHAAWHGENCMIETIENFTDIPIDYYIKVNFKGIVDLVDVLGGIEIEVPFRFCEQDSQRRWGKYTIFVEKGKQQLNGEQVLALARHRQETTYMASYCGKEYIGNRLNDIVRGENQQLIIKALLQKIKEIKDFKVIPTLLKTIQNNIDTNFPLSQIFDLYEMIKPILSTNHNTNPISIQKLHLSGYDQYIYDETFKTALYNYMYYEDSLNKIVHVMKENLNLIERETIKDFHYSIQNPYEETIIGKGTYTAKNYIQTMPNFVGKKSIEVEKWAKEHGYKITYSYQETKEYPNNQVLHQNYPYAYILKNITDKTLKITLSKNIPTSYDLEIIDCTLKENEENSLCVLPDFTGWTIEKLDSWYQDLNKYHIHMMMPIKNGILDNSKKENMIFSQSKEKGTLLKDIVSLEISYYTHQKEESTS